MAPGPDTPFCGGWCQLFDRYIDAVDIPVFFLHIDHFETDINMMHRIIAALVLALAACVSPQAALGEPETYSRYEPRDGRILVLAGQSAPATLDYYQLDNTPRPAGYSDYVSYDVGAPYKKHSPEYPRTYRGNDALLQATNWGSGEQCVACNLSRPEFSEAVINIGLYIAGPEGEDGNNCSGRPDCSAARLARGEFDAQLAVFADWLNSLEGRPVFLRIGYEFDGPWNGYTPEQFKAAWKHIHRFFSRRGVTNVAYVYHSFGFASMKTLEDFFPEPDEWSDSYVDWVGYSYFQLDPTKVGSNELAFARQRGMKVFLGEVAPHSGDCTRQIDVSRDEALARQWIENFFSHVEANLDVIRGIAYINENWSDVSYSPQWQDAKDQHCGGFFSRSNSRLNDSPAIEKYWAEKVGRDIYLNWEPDLYSRLVD